MIVAETEDSPSKSLAEMQVAAVSDSVSKDDVDVVTEDVRIASQECLLSSSGKGSAALERFLHGKLDILSAERLENIGEVDPSESNKGKGIIVEKVVDRNERLKLGDMDCTLR